MTKNDNKKTSLFAIPVLAALMLGIAIAPAHAGPAEFDCVVDGPTQINLELEPGENSGNIHKDIECNNSISSLDILSDCTEGITFAITLNSDDSIATIDETFGVSSDFEGDSIQCTVEFQLVAESGEAFFFPQEILIDVIQPIIDVDVDIDIKPGSDPNSINTKSMGVVPVAILGSDTFNVADVDVTSLVFGPNSASPVHDLTDPDTLAGHIEDVNDDGFLDLVSHYNQKEVGLCVDDTEATISGTLLDGTPFEGTDSVRPLHAPDC